MYKMVSEKLNKILLLIFVLYAGNTLACSCIPPKFVEKYIQSDFVAVAKIIKVYQNEGEEELYKADILIRDLFKGQNLNSIYIEGRSDGKKGSSCNLVIPVNTELIIYARKNGNNQFSFGSCSGYLILNRQWKHSEEQEKRELGMLNMLRSKNINYTNKIWFGKKMGFSGELERFKGVQLNKSYAVFELAFGANLAVKSVEQISGFGSDVDNELIKMLEKSKWGSIDVKSQDVIIKDTVPDGSKFLVGFYFYEAEAGYESFVGEYDL